MSCLGASTCLIGVLELRGGVGFAAGIVRAVIDVDGVRWFAARYLTSHCCWHGRNEAKRFALVRGPPAQQNGETLG